MTRQLHTASFIQMVLITLIIVSPAFGQGGRGGRGMMGDAAHAADMQLFHQLFEHRTEINREVVAREDGIETVTESKNPEVTRLLQTHVAAMLARVKEGRPIHQRDPLFRELFKNADRIEARHELTLAEYEWSRPRRTPTSSSCYRRMRTWSAHFSQTVCRR